MSDPQKILVISQKHGILPFAWRLKREGILPVDVVVMKDRFEQAWEPLLPKLLRGKDKSREAWNPLIESAEFGETMVVTDSPKAMKMFEKAETIYGPHPVTVGEGVPGLFFGMWNQGDTLVNPHWIVPDWGVWPGGMGPMDPGGVTMIRTKKEPPIDLPDAVPGLNYWGLKFDPVTKSWGIINHISGWPLLFAHAFISDLSSLTALLLGGTTTLEGDFVTVLPVTIPPWPIETHLASAEIEVNGLDDNDMGSIFFHDMKVVEARVCTTELDGFLCVVRGSDSLPQYARAKALDLARRVQVPQKQFRPDVGASIDSVLFQLRELAVV